MTNIIDKRDLTREEMDKLQEYRMAYTDVALCTDPMDHEKAADAVKKLYRLCGFAEPAIEYVDDPVQLQIRGNQLIGNKEGKYEFLRNYLDGQFDASMVGYYEFFLNEFGVVVEDQKVLDIFYAMKELAESSMWVLELDDTAIICERPCFIGMNDRKQLHCDYDMAIRWPSGLGFYYLEGIEVTEQLVMHPETLTWQQISNEQNVEIRRIMMQRLGWEKYLRYANAKVIDIKEDPGVPGCDLMLYEFFDEGHGGRPETIHVLRVWNGTPEADGSHKEYSLRVSHEINDALEAVLSTYPGITLDEYIQMKRA